MSHGKLGKISCSDADYELEQVTSLFSDENCPSLKGKPRMFFVQACRGSNHDSGYEINNKLTRYTVMRPPLGLYGTFDTTPFEEIGNSLKKRSDFVHNPPNHRDFLIVRSAMAGHVSYRCPIEGTWFIQDLCKELDQNGFSEDIMSILTHVNWSVSERKTNPDKKKQILCISNMLLKILRFNDIAPERSQ
jgi:caspase-like apoptosis-related cysteine protease